MVDALADPARRAEAAAALAGHWNVDAVLVLIRDHELGVLRPAPGFPQTLPGGPTWRHLFAECAARSEVTGTVAFPNANTLTSFHAFAGRDGTVLVLLGGRPALTAAAVERSGFRLLAALLRTESSAISSEGLATEARYATARATALAGALDAARSEIAAKAVELQRALRELRLLNATLENRVAERTRERDRTWRLSQDLLLVASFEARIEAVNPAWTTVLDWSEEELLGRPLLDLVHPDDCARSLAETARLATGLLAHRFENRCRRRDGAYRSISWTAATDDGRIYATGRDVTDERERAAALARAEEQLRQAQKMEAVGHLTGGIAHDFNNLLTVIMGGLEVVRRSAPAENGRLLRAAANAMQGAQRASALTHRLLAFSRRQPLDPKPTDINRLVRELTDMLHRSLGETIELEGILAARLWRAEVDANQLESALINLAVNARDAMPRGGKLTIETGNAHLDEGYVSAFPELRAGQYVQLSVSDTGCGMSKATLDRVFEPFFTTKAAGRGTGLSLSQVYGFVKQSGGHVRIYSEEGRGTTVKIYLPRSHGPDAPEEAARLASVPRGVKGETVLVVEDETLVRAYTCEVLRELGYQVLEAADAESALQIIDRHPDIALLFTDVVLPGPRTGRELAKEAVARSPRMKVLYTTGYARNAIVHHGRLDAGVQLITKPFTFDGLAAKVRDVLDGGAG